MEANILLNTPTKLGGTTMKPLMNLEIAEFCNQMHLMLASGISGIEALNLLLEDAQNDAEKELLTQMIDKMESTGYFNEAAESVQVFPNYALHMIKLGEETGTLDQVLGALSSHYTREENLSNMIKSALTYPCIMLGMMALIILVLLMKVMPIFSQVFEQLGQEMTGLSAALLNMGGTLKTYSLGFVIAVLVLSILLYVNRKKLPFQKNIQEMIATCRFADGMSIALKSGLTAENSLELATNLVENDALKEKIAKCQEKISEGTSLHEALKETKILNGSYARMAYIAGKSGVLDEAMEHIASEYEHMAYSKIHSLIGMLEPTLVMALSIIVGAILFSVMMPLLGIMSSL